MARFFPAEKLLPQEVLDRFKYEVAREIGLLPQVEDGYWGEIPARECGRVGGKIGGPMVRVLIRRAEEELARTGRMAP